MNRGGGKLPRRDALTREHRARNGAAGKPHDTRASTPDTLDRITIDAPGNCKTVLARKDEAWTIASLNNQPANVSEVTRLLDTLRNEQVTRFVEDVASDLPKYGHDQPQLQVTFSSFALENTAESQAGEQPFATVSCGKVEGEEVFARIGGRAVHRGCATPAARADPHRSCAMARGRDLQV